MRKHSDGPPVRGRAGRLGARCRATTGRRDSVHGDLRRLEGLVRKSVARPSLGPSSRRRVTAARASQPHRPIRRRTRPHWLAPLPPSPQPPDRRKTPAALCPGNGREADPPPASRAGCGRCGGRAGGRCGGRFRRKPGLPTRRRARARDAHQAAAEPDRGTDDERHVAPSQADARRRHRAVQRRADTADQRLRPFDPFRGARLPRVHAMLDVVECPARLATGKR
jgi:hypothetical protein